MVFRVIISGCKLKVLSALIDGKVTSITQQELLHPPSLVPTISSRIEKKKLTSLLPVGAPSTALYPARFALAVDKNELFRLSYC
jgi:hypothetical protein